MVPKKGFLTFLASAPSRSTAGQEVFSIGMCVKAAEIITFNLPGDPPQRGVTEGISHAGSLAFGISLERGFVVFLSVY